MIDAKVGSASAQERNPMNVGEAWGREVEVCVSVCVCTTPTYNIMSWGKIRRISCFCTSWLKKNGVLKTGTGRIDVC